jgi:2-polyprenyl-6-methoxyphenol hydroxylase-like FAD-dependent oxidoreductase
MKNLAIDVAIVGGELAGATAAAMLGRAGHDAILIDPHTEQHQEFRCEKLDDSQLALLRPTGLVDDVLPHTCVDGQVWIARLGPIG